MAQTNTNGTHVLSNDGNAMMPGATKPVINGTNMMGQITTSPTTLNSATSPIDTVLNANFMGMSGNNGNVDGSNNFGMGSYNDNYSSALQYADKDNVARPNTATLLLNNVANVEFLPTEAVAKTEWNADDKPADIAGSYLDATTWKALPTLTGTASAFTLSNTNDGNKTVVLSETISGSPFTTGNGAVSEAFTFRGANNDSLAIKHNVAVANVPATTNKNNASALDVRNESYAETYAKQGVTSNYAWTTAHKYAEVNGNQSLNDASAETYVYNDANLTINSSVKTAVADAAYINGVEKIVESNVANYNYAHKTTGSVNYVVTDTRNLAQVDQRTWTNTTVTNVAKFEVKDLVNATTITAKGLITGTTDNLSTAKSAATPTTFKATNAEFKVVSDKYTLTVDPKEFNVDHAGVASNALLTLVDATAVPTGNVFNSALGNVPAGQVSMADAFNPYVSTVGAVAGARLDGTQFADVITVKDTAAPFNANIDAGAGNDTITGGKGADTITVGTAAKEVDVIIGFEAQDKLVDAAGKAFQAKTVTQLADGNIEVVAANGYKVVLQKPSATLGDVQKYANPFDFSSATTAQTIGGVVPKDNDGADTMIGGSSTDTITGGKGADKLTGGAGADKFIFTDLTNGIANRVDTITDFSAKQGDKIDVSALGFKTFIGTAAFTATNATNALRFDDATDTLQGSTDASVKAELEVILTGVTAADLSAAAFIFA